MGCGSHRKISTGCVILILICAFGFRVIFAVSSPETQDKPASPAAVSTITTRKSTAIDSIEDVNSERITELDLEKAESKDAATAAAQKVEIIKQIQKVNNDGSYTVGYEADDGTFKIESRDVLGNVKGTFGYVDLNGEIKRVSYTANNGTGLKSQPAVSAEDMISLPRYNRTLTSPTTKRPPLYSSPSSSSTISPTRSTVIQTIPRRMRLSTPTLSSPTASSSLSSTTERPGVYREIGLTTKSPVNRHDPTTTVVYATSVPTPKSYVNIRPTPLPGTNARQVEQLSRPEKLEINHHTSNVQLSVQKDTSTSKPVVEEIDEKPEERKIIRGNALRRQLMQDSDSVNKFEGRQQPVLYSQSAGDDDSRVYGPTSVTARPHFPSTTTSRIPAIVLAARQRATQIQNVINNNNQQQQNSGEKFYIKPYRRNEEIENDTTTEPTSELTFLTQNPIPVQIPANRYTYSSSASGEEEKRVPRKQDALVTNNSEQRYRSQFVKVQQPSNSPRLVRIPLPQTGRHHHHHHSQVQQSEDPPEQYLRETTPMSHVKEEQSAEQEPVPIRAPQSLYRSGITPQYYIYPQQHSPEQVPTYVPPQSYPAPTYPLPPISAVRGVAALGPHYFEYPERPVTTRDFERLLQMLIYRYQRLQRLAYAVAGGNPYIGYSSTPSYPYDGYSHGYNRAPIYNPYDGRLSYRPGAIQPPVYPEAENMYQPQTPIPSTEPAMSYDLQRLIPRKKQFSPRYFGAQTGAYNVDEYSVTGNSMGGHPGNTAYLPADVREELLYRMLMLALQTDPATVMASTQTVATAAPDTEISTTTKAPIVYKKPIRSVQILGEEE